MTIGLERFKAHFRGYESHFVLIGGVAAMQWLERGDLRPRITKDFDIVLLVEKLDDAFLKRFWEFVRAGAYGNLRKSTGERVYYRFTEPEAGYPSMLEIFSRAPEGIQLWGDPRIIPLPADDDASSLSAILMDEDYYGVVRNESRIHEDLPLLAPKGLILLKAKAFLDLSARKARGDRVDEREIKKHRNDVFKLALLLPGDQAMAVPKPVHDDLLEFLALFPVDAPEWGSIRQASGLAPNIMDPGVLLEVLMQGFRTA